jgi:5-methylcytosine-specific restriction enzyme A
MQKQQQLNPRRPGCRANRRAEMRRTWSDGRRLRKDQGGYQWMYNTVQWRRRRLHQLRKYPLCAACLADNVVKAATVVHHVIDHRGDYKVFFNSPLESLCKFCHDNIQNGSKVLGYQRGCDVNGKPYKTNAIFIDHNKQHGAGALKKGNPGVF